MQQQKEQELQTKLKAGSGGWGSSLFGGKTITNEQFEELKEQKELLEEELEAKI